MNKKERTDKRNGKKNDDNSNRVPPPHPKKEKEKRKLRIDESISVIFLPKNWSPIMLWFTGNYLYSSQAIIYIRTPA